jgi:hypothetical protein
MLSELDVPAYADGEELRIESLRHLGGAPLTAGAAWRLIGQDGGQTIGIGDGGDTLFVFSDTLIEASGGRVLLANCAALSGETRLAAALAGLRYFEDHRGRPRQILLPNHEERRRNLRFWPAHGVFSGGKVYLFYLGIEFFNPSSDWGFRNLGAGLAVLDPKTGEAVRLRRGTMGSAATGDWCLWKAHGDDFHFGVQTLREGGWIYVYSSLRHGYHSQAGLARVAEERIGDPGAYTFLADPADGGSWTPDLAAAASLGPSGNDFSVSFNPFLGRYLMAYVDPYAKVLNLRHAPRPWGPWSPPQTVGGELPHHPGSELIFLGLEHPRFAEDGGRTVHLTYGQPHFVQNSLLALTFGSNFR